MNYIDVEDLKTQIHETFQINVDEESFIRFYNHIAHMWKSVQEFRDTHIRNIHGEDASIYVVDDICVSIEEYVRQCDINRIVNSLATYEIEHKTSMREAYEECA